MYSFDLVAHLHEEEFESLPQIRLDLFSDLVAVAGAHFQGNRLGGTVRQRLLSREVPLALPVLKRKLGVDQQASN